MCDSWRDAMKALGRIVGYAFMDIINHRGVYIALGAGILFLVVMRGCYGGAYTVNGREVDELTVAWHVSKVAFHIVAAGGLLVAAMISMRLLRSDRDEGTTTYMLAGPVTRAQYVLGRMLGLWLVCFALVFVLHVTILLLTLAKAGGAMPGYLTASVVCSLNLLLMVLLVGLLSLVLPDFIAGLVGVGVAGVSFVSDLVHRVMQNEAVRQSVPPGVFDGDVAVWRIVFPKFGGLQYYAASLIGESGFRSMGLLHPAVNVVLYVLVIAAVLVWRFRSEEI
ncbi:MAG: ABC transporter permease subunit [Chitinivibrionales bacterium]|nr:ABC transporter permease subunit [Chitinivibrionales bacterium]MBD3356945.1 ABC transporter permease subunit [Chitinivibrionales bacterium]